ncbi:hypothetical protein KW438_22060 [Vibrio fluvialis]|jgi:hypothetical protein|uniref:hypothetical protein n=1 Tax=Vibrio cincinnatiensis TaxID=675 RepID=UPI001C9DD6BD|nr:hypothetical protein [Vibrio cincinnatiensis]MBY7998096.1 hypothetical protein [Vibrio fluvialis]MCG3737829.1 hypothetical protein [Vibrio cincinnatiensis]
MSLDVEAVIKEEKAYLANKRASNYTPRKSKLEPFRTLIVELYTGGAPLSVIASKLHREHGQKASRSTIHRYLKSIGVTRLG